MIRNLLMILLTGIMISSSIAQDAAERPVVYVIPVKNEIEPALVYVVRRGIDEAVRANAQAIIFDMDTPGGAVSAAEDIIALITRTQIPTYTFVDQDAYSAGALIALATKNIYMAPGSKIGAATPLLMSPLGGVQEMPEDVQEKMTSAVESMARAAAEQGGHDPRLAEAFVRADNEYTVDGQVISEKGRLLVLTDQEAAKLVGEEKRPLLSLGTLDSVDELMQVIGLENAEKRVLNITSAEKLARLIARLAPILLLIGLGGIWLEFKTPGFGIFGILGITCLSLFFLGHHIAGLAGFEDVLLFILGLALLGIEVFITPGFGIMGLSGLLLIFVSFISAMSEHLPGKWWPVSFSPETFALPFMKVTLAFAGSIILVLLAGKFLPKTRLFNRLALAEVSPKNRDDDSLIGLEGVTRSDLRPSGTAYFDGRKLDVVTHGDYLPAQCRIRIVEVHGNRIVVEPVTAV